MVLTTDTTDAGADVVDNRPLEEKIGDKVRFDMILLNVMHLTKSFVFRPISRIGNQDKAHTTS